MLLMTALLLAQASPTPTLAKPSPRNLYVGCSLQASGQELQEPKLMNEIVSNSAARCMLVELQMLANFRGKDKESEVRFCPDTSASFDSKPLDAMSIAFVEFFESHAAALARLRGEAAMLLALRQKWPCN